VSASKKPKIHPKVMLIDLDAGVEHRLTEEGYNVTVGTFGRPYFVGAHELFQVAGDWRLPLFSEQEIVIVDTDSGNVALIAPTPTTPITEFAWWTESTGLSVDPRPAAIAHCQNPAARILRHGGLVILFAAPRILSTYIWGKRTRAGFAKQQERVLSNWSLLKELDDLDVSTDYGEEVSAVSTDSPLHKLLLRFIADLKFDCIVAPSYEQRGNWVTLATNKYGRSVAGWLFSDAHQGKIIVLPRVSDQATFLTELLSVLPDMSPHLFPESGGSNSWVRERDYELPLVVALNREMIAIEEKTRARIAELHDAIESEREHSGYMHDLLCESGDRLVAAVKKALEAIGFTSVMDADQALESGQRKREDLQVRDDSPVLLVEIKGLAGFPAEHDAIQVAKYVAPRMRDWDRRDVAGLSIINHQRFLPGLRRDPNPFTSDVLTNATDLGFGLMTSWDLFRLLRSFQKLGWKPENVKPLFYGFGRVEAVPAHYKLVGQVEQFWEKPGAVGIRLSDGALATGDRIAYQLPVEFEEETIESLQLEGAPANRADQGSLAGIKTSLTKDQARKGVRVYRATE
jgi:hypothetical protein